MRQNQVVKPPTHSVAQRQAERLRLQIATLIGKDDAIVEWNTRFCPDCRHDVLAVPTCVSNEHPHLPPLYYALGPEDASGDLALGLGSSEVTALTDLFWNLKVNLLLIDLESA
jgi:hypothetical protein